jgi:hypothetical protein
MNFIKSIKVYDTEYNKVRVGDNRDGGYVVLDEISAKTQTLYSYGVETNSSFENEFVEKYNCNAVLFDHTVSAAAEVNDKFTFVKEGLSHKKTDNCDTLQNHLDKYGCPKHKTLKMDIEWCEWDVFKNISDDILNDFDQILCEFHVIPVKYKDTHTPYFTSFHNAFYNNVNKILFEKYNKVFQKLQQYYYVFHVHVNNSIPCNIVENELVPPLIEMSLVNKNLIKNPTLSTSHFPTDGLDYPNKTDRPDITNIAWNS